MGGGGAGEGECLGVGDHVRRCVGKCACEDEGESQGRVRARCWKRMSVKQLDGSQNPLSGPNLVEITISLKLGETDSLGLLGRSYLRAV